MSHTTTIKDIIITDVRALKSAIQHLKKHGVDCDLLENSIPRAYSSHQVGMSEPAPFVLKLNKGNYDVGFYPIKDQGNKAYEVRTDFYTGAVESALGVRQEEGVSINQCKLGKLYQAYTVFSAQNKAVEEGYAVEETTDADGNIQLRLYA